MITPCYVLYQQYCGLQLKILAFITVSEIQGALKEVLMINECIYMASCSIWHWNMTKVGAKIKSSEYQEKKCKLLTFLRTNQGSYVGLYDNFEPIKN